jgi:signal transduction histidine kinase
MSIVILRDITAMVKLQESVLRAESMSSMGSLVAGVAHEVRNPLFAISATLDAFDARFRDRDDYKKYAQALRAQLDRMSNLMRDLLDYGRPAILEFRDVPPGELVRDAVRGCSDLASRGGIAIEVEAPEDLPAIRVDRGRTVQVFVNLVENAIQHSPENAPVVVRAEAAARANAPGVRFTVEDSGPGFQASDIPKLFDPFFTKRQGGTGLGLAIVRKIVEEHGGTISPANRSNGGAIVSVWLPCEPPGEGESERKA